MAKKKQAAKKTKVKDETPVSEERQVEEQTDASTNAEPIHVNLLSSDNDRFPVEKQVATMSELIKTMLEDLPGLDEEIPLPSVNSLVLQKVIEYCVHHVDDDALPDVSETPLGEREFELSEWDRSFFDIEVKTLTEVILAANYLNIRGLLEGGCKMVAEMLKGKSCQEMRDMFGAVDDFSPEEKREIEKENAWTEEG